MTQFSTNINAMIPDMETQSIPSICSPILLTCSACMVRIHHPQPSSDKISVLRFEKILEQRRFSYCNYEHNVNLLQCSN